MSGAPTGPDGPDDPTEGGGESAGLTHLDAAGRARMVDVGGKDVTRRTARAGCRVVMSGETARLLSEGGLPKGDALPVARLAGIQAAKRTAELIPLCHQIRLTAVDVEVTVDVEAGIAAVVAEARAEDRTGVEMEALVAASTAALALYDMCKAVERGIRIEELGLLEKRGGTSGQWGAPGR